MNCEEVFLWYAIAALAAWMLIFDGSSGNNNGPGAHV